ncbi:hypothetical protein PAE9249_02255 [Paenibacillus sp. CECT 9249]|uniref:type II toxin-antitoxin system RelE/ParE family toxin n=1 Tax=Paenibacillus sp. CECT 9249 TaxID=2845385 RepID=UPI001E298DDE|nr:type II toxin-antitoxin system RelE/ParE family toxin [Paenibacillus sp. CECT 9249]CAH0119747.1 hypothetical protein PAE9249_02255 [Paenibacillus sp. CECT 9249]
MPPQKSRVRYTPAAVDDMDEIFSYISEDNQQYAEKMLDKLNGEIGGLDDFTNYLVFYRIVNDEVIIHRLLHSRRNDLRELF